MFVAELVPLEKNKVQVKTDEEDFVLYLGECRRWALREQTELPEEVRREIWDVLSKRVKLRAIHLLERQERTEYQLRKKLREGMYPPSLIEEAVIYVKSFHYVDDLRYARSYISCRSQRESRRKMTLALRQRGVDEELIALAFDEMAEESSEKDLEAEAIQNLLTKRYAGMDWEDKTQKMRAVRYLCGKGFAYEQVMQTIRIWRQE